MGRFNFIGDVKSVGQQQLEFIDKVLNERGFKGPDVLIEQVGEAGDNYIANVKRIVITENGSTFKMIAKLAPSIPMMRDVGNLELLFNNELVIYDEVLPKFRELEKNAGVPKEDWFRFAECYGANKEIPNETILLEDLKEDNYVMLDRFKSLNNDCVKIVLKNLAIYHSLSFVTKHQEPEVFAKLKSKLRDMTAVMMKRDEVKFFFSQLEDNAVAILQDEKYSKYIKGSITQMAHLFMEANKDDIDSKYSIIQQGDGWTNNILFQMNGDTPKNCVLIDYQMAKESSPAYDIMYMLFNSTNYEQRQKHYYEYIDYYHKEMEKSLLHHGLDITTVYPREQLDADMKRYAKYMIAMSVMVSSFIIRSTEDASKMKETMETVNVETFKEDADKMVENMLIRDVDTIKLFKSKLEGLIDSYLEFGLIQE